MAPTSTRLPYLVWADEYRHRIILHESPDSEIERMEHRHIRGRRAGEHCSGLLSQLQIPRLRVARNVGWPAPYLWKAAQDRPFFVSDL